MSKNKYAVIAALLVGSAAAGASVLSVRTTTGHGQLGASDQRQSRQAEFSSEVITLTPRGFDPAEITRPRGRFGLRVNNRSGLAELDLQLSRDEGGREAGARVPNSRLEWTHEVNLGPGVYVLTEVGHPEWSCRITVTPN